MTKPSYRGIEMTAPWISRPPGTGAAVRRVSVLAVALAGALTMTACGSASGGGSVRSSGASPSATASPSSTAPRTAGQFGPAASGTVAAISGTTMQVQNQAVGQVAVSWTRTTKFTQAVTSTVSAAVKAGKCVVAVGPTGTSASDVSFTASTLVVTSPVNGECARGFGGGGTGERRPGFPSGAPSGRPSGVPTGGRYGTGGAVSIGKITSVSGGTFMIAAQSGSTTATTPKTILTDSSTKVTSDSATTSTSLKVGKCVTARGKTDSTGTVAATSVGISNAVNGQCTNGFGGLRNGG